MITNVFRPWHNISLRRKTANTKSKKPKPKTKPKMKKQIKKLNAETSKDITTKCNELTQ